MSKIPIVVVLGGFLLTTAVIAGDKSGRSALGNETVTAAASHFIFAGGDGKNAGSIASATGNIEGIGKATVDTSASWDWSSFTGSENFDITERHPCALMNTSSHTFVPSNDVFGNGFTADATVKITAKNGDEISGAIVGGSVCELTTPPCGTVNEGLTSFAITGGTGRFATATGSGLIRSVFDFCAGQFLANEIFLQLNR